MEHAKPQPTVGSGRQQQNYACGDLFNNMTHLNAKRSYSPFDLSPSFGFNNLIGSSPSQSTTSLQSNPNSQYYNGAFSYGQQKPSENRIADHLLGPENTSKYSYSGRYMDDSSLSAPYIKPYEDDTFLSNLHAGQRLNSEVYFFCLEINEYLENSLAFANQKRIYLIFSMQVTIHNVTDSKFNRSPVLNQRDGVEITPINGPASYSSNANLAVGSQRPTSTPAATSDLTTAINSEFGGNFFVAIKKRNDIFMHKFN